MNPSEPLDLAIRGDIVLDGGEILWDTWLGIQGGTIVSMSRQRPESREQHDASGKLLLPGFIDAHVHMRSSPKEGITATTLAAAAGGTTTAIDMPFDAPARPVRDADTLRRKIEDVTREAVVDVALYATFAPQGDLENIRDLAEAGACGFKVSTYGVDPVRFPRIPDGQLYEAFQEIALQGLPVMAHQENQEIVDALTARLRADGHTHPIHHARSRPPVAEAEAAGRLLEFAYWTGVHLHMVHGTIPRTFDLIEWNKGQGVNATGETCIQYLLLTEDALEELGGRAKCNPPLRSEENKAALWEGLHRGKIDIVTSDHSPYPLPRKETEDIFEALAGFPGAETLGTLLYSEGVAKGKIGLGTFVSVLASTPARIFGLRNKGRLRVGYDADVVVFDSDQRWTLDEVSMHYEVGWSPYHGFDVQGRVESTYLRGTCIYHEGCVTAEAGTGRFVRPDRALTRNESLPKVRKESMQ